MTVHLDTLAIAGKLRAAGFSEAQAEAMSFILRDARESELSQLATKSDLAILATSSDLAALAAASDRTALAAANDLAALAAEFRALELRLEVKIEAGKAAIKWVLSAIGFQTLAMVAAIVALSRSFQP
jgi:hypothetical protein